MKLQLFLEKLKQNNFTRAISLLVGGAAIAHLITALSLPIISRLYSPEEFGVLAVFNSVVAITAIAACLRFDIAVPLPEDEAEGFNLLVLSFLVAASVSVLIGIVLFLFYEPIVLFSRQPNLGYGLWLVPFAVFFTASSSALQNWCVRQKAFSAIAQSRIAQSGGASAIQFLGALHHFGPIALMLGSMCNSGAGVLILGPRIFRYFSKNIVSWRRIKSLAVHYKAFPRYSAIESFLNIAAMQLPIIMISSMVAGKEAGYLLLAISVLQAPMALFGVAVGQVYLSHAPGEERSGTLSTFTIETTRLLVKAGVGPLLAAGCIAPFIFPPIFGEGWGRAGVILAWMTPWFIMQFITSPVSMALIVTGHQRRAMLLQLMNFILRPLSVLIFWIVGSGWITEAYAVSGFLVYFIYFAVVSRTIRTPMSALASALWQAWLPIIGWLAAAGATIIISLMIF